MSLKKLWCILLLFSSWNSFLRVPVIVMYNFYLVCIFCAPVGMTHFYMYKVTSSHLSCNGSVQNIFEQSSSPLMIMFMCEWLIGSLVFFYFLLFYFKLSTSCLVFCNNPDEGHKPKHVCLTIKLFLRVSGISGVFISPPLYFEKHKAQTPGKYSTHRPLQYDALGFLYILYLFLKSTYSKWLKFNIITEKCKRY